MDAMEPFSGEPFISADPKTITDFEVSAEIVVRKGPMDDADPLAFEARAVVRPARQPGLAAEVGEESVMIKRAWTASCIAMAASSIQAAAVGERLCGGLLRPCLPLWRPGRLLARHGDRAEASIACMAARFISPSRPRSPKLLAHTWRTRGRGLANPPADGLAKRRRRRVFPYLAGRLRYRGYNRDIETYINPFAAEDPGQPQVTSRIGEGFNLDGKIKPNDFVSPDGEGDRQPVVPGWGCDAPWRGANGNGTLVLRSNDKMLEGLYTVVIRISGNKDPMNDDDATLEIGYSPDQIMKDARGNVGIDYSYRILKSEQYTKLKARIKDGVVETEQADIHMPQIAWFNNQLRDAFSARARYGWSQSDGTAAGLVGGYRDFRDLYTRMSSPNPAVCRVFASMKITSRCTTLAAPRRRHVQCQDRPLRRHLQRLSHEAAGFCRGPRQADGYS